MLAQGWVEEVQGLISRHGGEVMQQIKAIGYPLIAQALVEGKIRKSWKRKL